MEPVSYRCGDFHVDAANRRFTCRGVEVALEPRTFAVILQLLGRPNSLITRNELLDAVWGHRYVTPSTLNRVIALARRAFGDDTAEPAYIVTVHGAGYRYVGPIERDAPARSDQPVRFGPPPPARLPARIDALIGRDSELEALERLVRCERAVTVLGPGGIGKTQCTLETARRMAPDFPDGVWFFDLAPHRSGSDWLRALAATLAIPAEGSAEILASMLPVLQGRRALLVLDNCDRIAAEVGALVIELLRGTDLLKVVATSQAPLSFAGEHPMRLPPLAVPAAAESGSLPFAEIAAAAAVEMLVARVRAVQPSFHLTQSNAPAVAEICRRLDGMPLALELAAARFALLSPEQVLARLDQRFQFLRSSVAGRDARHQNLLLLLDWSFSLLSREEQQLLCWFSVFVQGWTVEAAIDLAQPLGHCAETAVDLLTGLVEKSLVTLRPGLMPPRYQLLETVREYAAAQLRAAEDEPRARRAHLALMARMAESAHTDMVGGRMRECVEQLMHEHGNISAAVQFALEAGADPAAALRIAGGLALYVKARGAYDVGPQWCLSALARTQGLATRERGRALLCLGVATVHRGSSDDSTASLLLEAARIAHLNEDDWGEAYANGYYALWLCNWGRFAEAPAHVGVLEGIAARRADPMLAGLAGLARGWMHIAANDHAAAVTTLRAVRWLGADLHQRHFIDMYIGFAQFALGDLASAAAQFLESLQRAAEVYNIRGVAGAIEGCGYIAAQAGELSDAARFLAVARHIRERTRVPLFNFWIPHHQRTHALLREGLGAAAYESHSAAGARMREEDAANEVSVRLQRFSEGANSPAGS